MVGWPLTKGIGWTHEASVGRAKPGRPHEALVGRAKPGPGVRFAQASFALLLRRVRGPSWAV